MTPTDSEITEGHTAILQCQVANQIGQVQWTKDGLTLGQSQLVLTHISGKLILFPGFDRHLPGFVRYSVLGDDSDGTFNLQVVNASKKDEAKYECQVGPGRGNPPIRASAFLTVNCESISNNNISPVEILLQCLPPKLTSSTTSPAPGST